MKPQSTLQDTMEPQRVSGEKTLKPAERALSSTLAPNDCENQSIDKQKVNIALPPPAP